MIKYQQIWEKVKSDLKASNDEATFNQIFEPITNIFKFQDNSIYLVVNSALTKYRIDRFFLLKMNDIASQYSDEKISFVIITKDVADKEIVVTEEKTPQQTLSYIIKRNLKAEYTFENFITGEANR